MRILVRTTSCCDPQSRGLWPQEAAANYIPSKPGNCRHSPPDTDPTSHESDTAGRFVQLVVSLVWAIFSTMVRDAISKNNGEETGANSSN